MYFGPDTEETWKFERYRDKPAGMWDELTKQVTHVYLVQKHPSPEKDAEISEKEN